MLDTFDSHHPEDNADLAARLVGALLNSFLWGMAIALAFNRWTWLEMRFNVGWILFGVWIIAFVLVMWRKREPLGLAFSIVNTALCTLVCVVLSGGIAQALVIPACLIREGLMQTSWNMMATNVGIPVFLAVCLVAIGLLNRGRRTGRGRQG